MHKMFLDIGKSEIRMKIMLPAKLPSCVKVTSAVCLGVSLTVVRDGKSGCKKK